MQPGRVDERNIRQVEQHGVGFQARRRELASKRGGRAQIDLADGADQASVLSRLRLQTVALLRQPSWYDVRATSE